MAPINGVAAPDAPPGFPPARRLARALLARSASAGLAAAAAASEAGPAPEWTTTAKLSAAAAVLPDHQDYQYHHHIYHSHARRDLTTNHTQRVTLAVIAAYVVAIAILWNIPVVSYILWPFKMLVIAFHEFGHAFAAVCTGGKVVGITLDPREGGETRMIGGRNAITLPAGYLGSSLIGALLIFAGFHVNASKVASIVLGVCFLLTLWWGKRDWLTILTILLAVGLLVGFWFISHAHALRFLVLFIGVMSSLYSAWDICDDLILRKVHSSDASVFARRYGGSSVCWGVIWVIISLCFMAAGIVAGIAAFPQSFEEQNRDSQHFLPT